MVYGDIKCFYGDGKVGVKSTEIAYYAFRWRFAKNAKKTLYVQIFGTTEPSSSNCIGSSNNADDDNNDDEKSVQLYSCKKISTLEPSEEIYAAPSDLLAEFAFVTVDAPVLRETIERLLYRDSLENDQAFKYLNWSFSRACDFLCICTGMLPPVVLTRKTVRIPCQSVVPNSSFVSDCDIMLPPEHVEICRVLANSEKQKVEQPQHVAVNAKHVAFWIDFLESPHVTEVFVGIKQGWPLALICKIGPNGCGRFELYLSPVNSAEE
jgi:hypothetical protein